MVQNSEKTLTLAGFLQLPETKPATEYIEGQLVQKPMPQGKHSKLQGKLGTEINNIAEPQQIALAFPELRCTFGDRSIVPDIAVFTWDRIPLDQDGDIANVFNAPPDWTIEILSPDQNQSNVTANILHCLKFGCQMGWLIDPKIKSVFAYPSGQQPDFIQEPEQLLPVPAFMSTLQLTVGELFGWLKLANS
ncbi:Uma2 family endonuclease [Leptolyngbya sp. FACHB-17]|uniref:Uma2 family endonuclease n=1 Tax=unclassified Leptolyngbya TaxID=2650499 RepID=UPI00168127F3|nr:Uma2 family endonuclease [Leptolyngbya sp. FACHB-17]MBD2082055.1 Uma2 family endonuclease [Leptolyngbya sp. FACHB-17]